LALALIALAFLGAAAAAGTTEECAAPQELVEDAPRLPATKARLLAKEPVKIVALGGASTAGAASGNPDKAWPARLEAALKRRWPGVPVTVVNKGVPRQKTQDMIERLPTDVFPEAPALVIWETGILDAVRGVDIDEFNHTLEAGIEQIRNGHSEIMLMDMQFSRSTASLINFDRYLEALHKTAELSDIYMFRRYEIMRYWSENGVFDFDDISPAERAALATRVYECVAERLADAIAIATQ
jgi:acyl-CoA thioesterase I